LDILRALAVAKDRTSTIETLQDWLWPDLDGDQAKAACEQALHRLRKLLGDADLIVQRGGKLRLAMDKVWVDLASWEESVKHALSPQAAGSAGRDARERAFLAFPGPLLLYEHLSAGLPPVAERVRGQLVDLAARVGRAREQQGDGAGARATYLRALEFYPDAVSIHEALIRGRLVHNDVAGALTDYARYEHTVRATAGETPAPAIRALVQPFLAPAMMPTAGALKRRPRQQSRA
jgi:DNA-binding SARP family transcriptional activator